MSDIFKFEEKESGGPDVIERALFFVVGERCYLLHEVGATIEADLEGCCGRDTEAGPWTEIPKADGLWVWEGTPGWASGVNWEGIDEGGEPIYEKRGVARRPRGDEIAIILSGPISKLWTEESGPTPHEGMVCATFSATSIPPDVRARMDADREAAEKTCPNCHGEPETEFPCNTCATKKGT